MGRRKQLAALRRLNWSERFVVQGTAPAERSLLAPLRRRSPVKIFNVARIESTTVVGRRNF